MGTVRRIKPPASLLEAVTAAIDAMHWLGPSDAGMVELVKVYARQIDEAEGDNKAIGWAGQNLAAALKSLGGTPVERKALGIEAKVDGKLAQLRAGRK